MLTTEIEKKDYEIDLVLNELEQSKKLCSMLMQTPHYAKLGEVGIFTIIQKAKSAGLNVLEALNGGMYFINGKVELTSNTMNYLIRSKGHSISKDPKSDKNVCILNGKRVDNGDTWTISYSVEDAKKAGIYRNSWEKYPEDMLFARALSRLARQLFPDVIKGCYVEGEILPNQFDSSKPENHEFVNPIEEHPTIDQINILESYLDLDLEYKEKVLKRVEGLGFKGLKFIPMKLYDVILKSAQEKTREEVKLEKATIEQEIV